MGAPHPTSLNNRAHGKRRLHDALLTRLSNDDDMEKSLSTFANEMASCAMILGPMAPLWYTTSSRVTASV